MDLRIAAHPAASRPLPLDATALLALHAAAPSVQATWAQLAGAQGAHDALVLALRTPRGPVAAAAFAVLLAHPGPASALVRSLVDHPVLGLRARAWQQAVGDEPILAPGDLWPDELVVALAAAAWRHGPAAAVALLERAAPPSARGRAVAALAAVDDDLAVEVLALLADHGGARVARAAREARHLRPSPASGPDGTAA